MDLQVERRQLLDHWSGFFAKPRCPFLGPIQMDRLVRRVPPTKHESNSMRFRKIHDRYGWMAKEDEKKPLHGLCSGAIYRTAAFMSLAQEVRCGSNPRSGDRLCRVHRAAQTVHIEHTVPSRELAVEWDRLPLETSFLPWMIRHSVCTAAHHDEKPASKGLIRNGYSTTTNALIRKPGHEEEFDKPFMRYEPDSKVWNVFTEELVERESFTFADHLETVVALCLKAGAPEESIRKLTA